MQESRHFKNNEWIKSLLRLHNALGGAMEQKKNVI